MKWIYLIICIDIQGWKMHYSFFIKFIEMQFDYKSKYIAQIIYNKTFFYLNKSSSQR